MKTQLKVQITLWLTALVLAAACVKEPLTPLGSKVESIKVFATDATSSPATKTTLDGLSVSWVAGDKVGLFSPNVRRTPGDGVNLGVTNLEYTAVNSATVSEFNGTMYWHTGPHDFFAYYPRSTGEFHAGNVPVSVPSTQNQDGVSSAHLANYDLLIANPVKNIDPGTVDNPATLNLRFNHLFTLLDFRIASLSDKTITEIELEAPEGSLLSVSGTLDITKATPASGVAYQIDGATGSNKVKVVIGNGGLDPTDSYNTTPGVYMIINPGDYTGQTLKINIKTNDNNIYTLTRQGIDFKRETRYLVRGNDEFGADPVPLNGVANSYIINPKNLKTTFTFPITQSNNYWSSAEYGNTPANVIGESDGWVASVIWQEKNKLITLADGGKGTGNSGVVMVQVNSGTWGNALIGIKRDSNGDGVADEGAAYLWSWHLWVTDYNPDVSVTPAGGVYSYPVTNGNVHRHRDSTVSGSNFWASNPSTYLMDRYLGAEGPDAPTNEAGKGHYGVLHYQFGRKDPFPAIINIFDGDGNNVANPVTIYSGTYTKNEANQNPTTFVYGGSNWWNDTRTNLSPWQDYTSNDKTKSLMDPCPSGWRVAINNLAWADFDNTKLLISNMGSPPHLWIYNTASSYYAAYGFRNYTDGQTMAIGWQSTVWSRLALYNSNNDNMFRAMALVTNVTGESGSYTNYVEFKNSSERSMGFSVRCMKY